MHTPHTVWCTHRTKQSSGNEYIVGNAGGPQSPATHKKHAPSHNTPLPSLFTVRAAYLVQTAGTFPTYPLPPHSPRNHCRHQHNGRSQLLRVPPPPPAPTPIAAAVSPLLLATAAADHLCHCSRGRSHAAQAAPPTPSPLLPPPLPPLLGCVI